MYFIKSATYFLNCSIHLVIMLKYLIIKLSQLNFSLTDHDRHEYNLLISSLPSFVKQFSKISKFVIVNYYLHFSPNFTIFFLHKTKEWDALRHWKMEEDLAPPLISQQLGDQKTRKTKVVEHFQWKCKKLGGPFGVHTGLP